MQVGRLWENGSTYPSGKNVKHCHAICLKSGFAFFTSLIKLLFEVKTSVCSTIK